MKLIRITFGLALMPVAAFAQEPPASPSASPSASAMAQRWLAMKTCALDVRTLCPGIQRGGGRIAQCLMANAAKVSVRCRDAIKRMRAGRKAGGT